MTSHGGACETRTASFASVLSLAEAPHNPFTRLRRSRCREPVIAVSRSISSTIAFYLVGARWSFETPQVSQERFCLPAAGWLRVGS